MPTYEYECTHCGHSFEAFQKMSDEPLSSCPKCSKKVKRLISSGAGIIFKGAGFYATDYRKKTKATDTNACKEGCKSCPHNK
jgi:putative FmdB family regulatory protein